MKRGNINSTIITIIMTINYRISNAPAVDTEVESPHVAAPGSISDMVIISDLIS